MHDRSELKTCHSHVHSLILHILYSLDSLILRLASYAFYAVHIKFYRVKNIAHLAPSTCPVLCVDDVDRSVMDDEIMGIRNEHAHICRRYTSTSLLLVCSYRCSPGKSTTKIVIITCHVIVVMPLTNPCSRRAVHITRYNTTLSGLILHDIPRHLTFELDHVL